MKKDDSIDPVTEITVFNAHLGQVNAEIESEGVQDAVVETTPRVSPVDTENEDACGCEYPC